MNTLEILNLATDEDPNNFSQFIKKEEENNEFVYYSSYNDPLLQSENFKPTDVIKPANSIQKQLSKQMQYIIQDSLKKAFKTQDKLEFQQLCSRTIEQVSKQLDLTLNGYNMNPFQSQVEIKFEYQNNNEKRLKRGPYKKYSKDMKSIALIKLRNGENLRSVSQEMDIPLKNLRRWIDNGAERKKGGGRKRMDQEMEDKLHHWCILKSIELERPVSRKQIRNQALTFSKFPKKFKASKGWTDKFVKKFSLRKKIIKQTIKNEENGEDEEDREDLCQEQNEQFNGKTNK